MSKRTPSDHIAQRLWERYTIHASARDVEAIRQRVLRGEGRKLFPQGDDQVIIELEVRHRTCLFVWNFQTERLKTALPARNGLSVRQYRKQLAQYFTV